MIKKVLLIFFIIGLGLFVSGCIDDEFTAEQIAEKLQEKQANIEDYSATVHMTVSVADQVQETEYEIFQKEPDKSKTITLKPEEEAGSVTVYNGKKMWIYDSKTNIVKILETPETNGAAKIDDYATFIAEMLNESSVSMEGTETIDDRETYVIDLKPKKNISDTVLAVNMTVWVDVETWMPLKIEMIHEDANQPSKATIEYRNFKVNTGISDEEFEFEIPEGAQVKDLGSFEDTLPVQMTLEEVQQKSQSDLLVPSYIPEGYEFQTAMLLNNSVQDPDIQESVRFLYLSNNGSMIISEEFYDIENVSITIIEKGERVDINGNEGVFSTKYDKSRTLLWNVGNARMSISAFLDEEEILKIARSMEVPNSIIENEL